MFLCLATSLQAQAIYAFDQTIPVLGTVDTLKNPWAGGIDAAQFNTIDLNNDGVDDLVLFDRMSNTVLPYLRLNGAYHFAPDYRWLFPAGVTNWMLLRDYDCDGKKDIFCGDLYGIKVYRNITTPGSPMAWQQIFFTDSDGLKSSVVLTKGATQKYNIQLQYDDLPSIIDLDEDGDLDIVCMRYAGTIQIEVHQNMSKENYTSCDSLDFQKITDNWGDFEECTCGNFAFNGTACPPSSSRIMHASGKSLTVIDVDDDHKMDLLFSEADCNELYLLKNTGTSLNAIFTSASIYPPALSFYIFPAAFYEDVDGDDIKDLIITPNLYNHSFLESDFSSSTWYYKNVGSNEILDFEFKRNNFLQDQMIDVGDNSVPSFTDYDGDGDLDMFIGFNSHPSLPSMAGSIAFWENNGNRENPSFKFVTNDFEGLSQYQMINVKPQFADLTADGKIDLVFSATRISDGATYVYYVEGKSRSNLDIAGQPIKGFNFPLNQTENIFVSDLNNDGRQDILVGKSNGSVSYWKNNGAASGPAMTLVTDHFAGLTANTDRSSPAISISDLNADGKADLLVSDRFGRLNLVDNYKQYADVSDHLDTSIVLNPNTETGGSLNLGGNIWPVSVDLFGSQIPLIAVGSTLGGVLLLKSNQTETNLPDFYVMPNPVENGSYLNIKLKDGGTARIYTIQGQPVGQPTVLDQGISTLQVPALAAGIYILQISGKNKTFARRIAVY